MPPSFYRDSLKENEYGYAVYGYAVYGYAVYGYSVCGYAVYGYAVYGYAVYGYAVYGYAVFGILLKMHNNCNHWNTPSSLFFYENNHFIIIYAKFNIYWITDDVSDIHNVSIIIMNYYSYYISSFDSGMTKPHAQNKLDTLIYIYIYILQTTDVIFFIIWHISQLMQ